MRPHLDVIELVVEDMASTLAFYRHLGLDIASDADKESHVEVAIGGGLRLAFDTEEIIRSIDGDWTPPSGGHRMALAFRCDSPTAVDQIYAELVGLGYSGHKAPWDAFWGQRYATVLDPDGTPVDFFAPLTTGQP